ncbi:NAD(P)/FAD-dependent oxidoreductase [Aquibaculum sediminis]|uniref:NAD(P)/FAD-dependent oxidoreductase n=1 Tax=Aquibaculum sediminis TaxID=3231907 RepID=UPI0034545E30
MGPVVDPVTPDEQLPEKVDVVVVGAGIVGTCTALSLAERGVSVALCEKGEVACEQSSRNWGWVRTTGRDSREMPLIQEAQRLWDEMNAKTGADTGLRRPGIAYLADSDAKAEGFEHWLAMAKAHQVDSRLVTGAELEALMPGATRSYKAGLLTPSDGRAEPQKAAPAIASAAQRLGAKLFTRCAVRGIETEAGRVSSVITERGRIACSSVVLAGGAWSRLFCARHALTLPQLTVRASVFRTTPVEGGPDSNLWTPKVALRKRLDGGYSIANGHANLAEIVPDHFAFFFQFLPALRAERGSLKLKLNSRFIEELRRPKRWALDAPSPFEANRCLDPEPVDSINQEAWDDLRQLFPVFQQAQIAQAWAGMIDVTPDAVPVISEVEQQTGFFVATGFSGHGFGIGPGAGTLMAELVTGAPPCVDPTPFRFSRYSDGSKPRLEIY